MIFPLVRRNPLAPEKMHAPGFMSKTRFTDDDLGTAATKKRSANRRKRGLCPLCARPFKFIRGIAVCSCGHAETPAPFSHLARLAREAAQQ